MITVPQDAQEILAQIQRNQEIISAITTSNDQLIRFLLVQGIEGSMRELPAPEPLCHGPVRKQLAAPKSSRTKHVAVKVSEKQQLILDYVNAHGRFDMAGFRAHYLSKKLGPASFVDTSVYTSLAGLVARSLLTKISPGIYELAK